MIRKVDGLSDEQARWTPHEALIPLLGIINHLTHVEWRWIDGGMLGQETSRSDAEFTPGPELTLQAAVAAYRKRAAATEATVTAMALDQPCRSEPGANLRWVLLHLVNETARHAGHADATRELLDGATGECDRQALVIRPARTNQCRNGICLQDRHLGQLPHTHTQTPPRR